MPNHRSSLSSDDLNLSVRSRTRLRVISEILESFDGSRPFSIFLGQYFRRHRSFGSTDRRIYRNWCYAWFRTGNSLRTLSFERKIFISYFLVYGISDELSKELSSVFFPESNLTEVISLNDRVSFVEKVVEGFSLKHVFPSAPLSASIHEKQFYESHFKQPDVFIRIARSRKQKVQQELSEKHISWKPVDELDTALRIDSGTDLTTLSSYNKGDFEIQDLSSQLAGFRIPAEPNGNWWDCCCGAGGKSLLLKDRFPSLSILASDPRESIITNFKQRIQRSGLTGINFSVLDATCGNPGKDKLFDGIIADVPCSGSGTWSRNPEWLSFFDEVKLESFALLQKKIISNVTGHLKPGGTLVYITCSVFRNENEEICEWIIKNSDLRVIDSGIIAGYENRADTMFAAIFQKQI